MRDCRARLIGLAALFLVCAQARAAFDTDGPTIVPGRSSVQPVPALSMPVMPGLPGVAGLPSTPVTPEELTEAAYADQLAQGIAAGAPAAAAIQAAMRAERPAALPAPAPSLIQNLVSFVRETMGPAASAMPGGSGAIGPRLIDHLRAEVPMDAGESASAADEKTVAEEAFNVKAGGSARKRKKADDEDEAGDDAPKAPADGGRGGNGGGRGGGKKGNPDGSTPSPNADDGGGDKYPRETVTFHDNVYPAAAFRPNMPIEPLIISAIDSAKKEIYLSLYEFKLTGVLDALRAARERGVKIKIILDYSQVFPSQEEGSDYNPKRSKEIWALLREGFDVKVLRGLGQYGINHNKFVVIDPSEKESLGEFGSYNWAWTAENTHYENANFTTERERIDTLLDTWKWLDTLAQPVDKAQSYKWPKTVPARPGTIPTLDFNGAALPISVYSPNLAPGESIEDRLVQAIGASKKSIDVSIFALRSTRIVEALLAASKKPGMKVRVIMDRGQSESEPFGPYAQWLAFHGIEVRTLAGPDPDSKYPMAQKSHHKLAIFDGQLVETGSANYTKYAALANYENAHFLKSAKTAQTYTWIYERMWRRAEAFPKPSSEPALPTEAELMAELQKDPAPPAKRAVFPGPASGIRAADLPFHGETFPSYAFRPDTEVSPMLVKMIKSAKKSIRLALYEFNLEQIMDALREAQKKGLTIELVIDRSHVYTTGRDHTGNPRKPSAQIQALIAEGFDVLVLKGDKSGIQHNKYAVIDAELGESLVEFGSYNWATTAENNHFENVNFSTDRGDVADYLAYFKYQRSLAKPVDQDKLQEVLSRGLTVDVDEEDIGVTPQAAGVPGEDERTSKLPPPPESTAPTIRYNGEEFHRHYFSPQGGIEDAWVRAIGAAKESIDMAVFAFWSEKIAVALVDALKKNPQLQVRLLLDSGQSKLAKIQGEAAIDWFREHGITDEHLHTIAGPNEDGDPMFEKQHNKLIIIDGKLLLTGSFNPSPTAENNSFENENVFNDENRLTGFVDFFVRMWREAERRNPPKPAAPTRGHVLPNGA